MVSADNWLADYPELRRTTQTSAISGPLGEPGFGIFCSAAANEKFLGRLADHPGGTLGGPHKFWVIRHKNIEKYYAYFDNHTSNMAASSGTIGHGIWLKKFLGFQSDQYLVIPGSLNRFIGRIWRPGDRLAVALVHHWIYSTLEPFHTFTLSFFVVDRPFVSRLCTIFPILTFWGLKWKW